MENLLILSKNTELSSCFWLICVDVKHCKLCFYAFMLGINRWYSDVLELVKCPWIY